MRPLVLLAVIGVAATPDGRTPPRADATVSFHVREAGRVSLAVYDRDGRLVRTLLTGRPLPPGRHAATWDGLDRYGRPLPAGGYTWKLVATTGLRAEFVCQVGQNTDPAWERATGNHEAPVGVGIDATGLYRVGATNEGGHYALKTDLDGRHVWAGDRGSADPWAQGTVAVALANGKLFELLPNGDLYGYDAGTGRVFTGADADPKPWNLGWNGYTPPAGAKDDEKRKLRAKECPRDLAGGAGDVILAAYPQYDAVCWFSARDGTRLDTATGFTNLAGVAGGRDGTAFAIAGGAVVAFTRAEKVPTVVVPADRLRNPWRLAVDAKSGDVLVAENSLKFPGAEPHHQVKRFDPAGKLLGSYGRPEGRGDGAYVPTDFRGVTDVEADHAGGFVVTEGNHTPPRRTARFDAGGRLVREWYGAQHYGVLACPEPADPRFVWTLANAPQQGLVRWEVDYAKRTWRVAEVHQDVFAAHRYARVPQVPDVFEHGGRIYIQGGALYGGLSLVVYDPKAKRVRPCVGSEWADAKKSKAFLWCDRDDDGLATDDEVTWVPRGKLGGWIDPTDLSLRAPPNATERTTAHRFDPVRLTPGGTPVYADGPSADLPAVREAGGVYHPFDYRRDAAGNTFGCFADGAKNPHEGAETHGAWYYNSCSAIDRLVKWDGAGGQLWSVGRHSPDADHETGSTALARGLVGLTHGCVVWGDASDEESARPTVWTDDGLYVDELLRVPTDFVTKDAYGIFNANEYPCGRLHTNPTTGEVLYFALNSGGGAPIYRITGWGGWHRQEGKITLTGPATAARRDGTGLTGEYFNTPDCSGEPALTRKDQLVYFNWGKGTPDKAITADAFSVRWTGQYEAATNEAVRFEARGNFPWRDRGRPTFTKLWLNGRLAIDSGSETNTVRVKLTAGQRVDVKLECGFKKGEAAVALSHDTPGLDRRAVLPEFLHPKAGGRNTPAEVVAEKRPAVLARFDFEEEDGPLAWSAAGGDVFGRLTGGARRVPGKVGNGIELTANGEFAPALFPVDEELRLPDADYAVAFWFKTTAADVRLCEAKRYSSYNNRWSDHTLLVRGGRLQFRLRGADPLTAGAKVNDGSWHHVVSTVGGGGHKLYLGGKLVATGNLTRRALSSNRLGLDLGPGGGTGSVAFDDLRVLGRAPTADEVAAIPSSAGK
jgi:hypothetical protein